MQILYYQYQPHKILYAHVLEHCLHDILIRDYNAEILSAKTGLGYSEVAFKTTREIKSLKNLSDKLDKDLFTKHQKLVLSEVWQKGRNFFILTDLLEYGCNSITDLHKIKKNFYNISYQEFISFCKKTFNLQLVKNFGDMQAIDIKTRKILKPKIDSKSSKKQLENMSIIEYGWFVPIQNVAEGIVLKWFYENFLKNISKEVNYKGIAYYVDAILHKPCGNWLFVNISIVTDKIAPIKFSPKLNSKQFSERKQKFIKELKKNKVFDLKDAFYQKMDWGNYMTDEEIISHVQETPYSKWNEMFNENAIKYKVNFVANLI